MQRLYVFLSALLMVALLLGCGPNANQQPTGTSAPPTATKSLEDYRFTIGEATVVSLTATAQTAVALGTPPADCPVTVPGEVTFKAPEPFSPDAPWDGNVWFGSEGLWTALDTNGTWTGLPHNPAGYTQKIMWWSDSFILHDELQPELVVSGRRLDAEAPPLRFYGATHAMADDIGEAMLTGVDFPTLGCWEVTGEYKDSALTFVVWLAP